MIPGKFTLRLPVIIFLFILFITSCRKDEPGKSNSYYVSNELIATYDESFILGLLDAASAVLDIDVDLKPLVGSGAELYKMVYETTVGGKKIKASGLVCVPTEPGDYPVLSFQNGTNTRHSNAPSKLPATSEFQIIEVIASMGYVVVIADYPGFGESSQIPHPYLVAEPTIRSVVDMFYALNEMDEKSLPEISVKNDYYLIGYSQGGWATLQLHKALELEYNGNFNLRGSCAGAGPYNIYLLMQKILGQQTFPMPYYIGYVINGYKAYDQFTNPVSDLLNEPYASRIDSLFTGELNSRQINDQLTTSIPDLINPDFLSGFATSQVYTQVREAMIANSIAPWRTNIPLLMIHGDADTHVDPLTTEDMYAGMIKAGTPADIIHKVMLPGADHGTGVVPAVIQGFLFLDNIKNSDE